MRTSSDNEIDTLRRKAYYLEVINAFASQLLQASTADEVVWMVAKHAIARLGFTDCIVYLWDDEQKALVQRAAHGPKNPIAFDINTPIKLKLGEGICGHVAKTGVAELISDTSKDPRYVVDDMPRLSEITVPILSDGKVIGIIDSEHAERNYYTEQHLEILNTIATMASAKIVEAQGREILRLHKEALEESVAAKTRALSDTIDQLKLSHEELQKSNQEKETLLKEIHHRVKNNLQIVSSLLNLHSGYATRESESTVFLNCRNRILSMAAIHEQLYSKESFSGIDLKQYISELCENLLASYGEAEYIKLHLDLEALSIDLQSSVPLGLVLNELVANSLQHAFPKGKGSITVAMSSKGNWVTLIVKDDGVGFDLQSHQSAMGFELIETLSEQLGGETEFASSSNGTIVTLRFPESFQSGT